MATPDQPIRVIAPLTPALERVKTVLFRPFQLEKWLAIGFCAWLAFLGQGTGSGGGGGMNYNTRRGQDSLLETLHQAREWVVDNLNWLLPLAVGVGIVGLAFWVLLHWLSSRGRFMFLHGVARNVAEIRVPWERYAAPANSLFVFRLALTLVMFVVILPLAGAAGWLITTMVAHQSPDAVRIMVAAALVLLAGTLGLGFVIVIKLTSDFVVPLMYLGTPTCVAAWREFLSLIAAEAGSFALYLLFQIVLKMAIGIAILAVVLVTCCLAGCLLALPYVGTVLLLPILIFERSYSLYFLAQFGPKYDVFAAEARPGESV